MKNKRSIFNKTRVLLVAVLMLGLSSACSSTGGNLVYISMGDSLAAGIQADDLGNNIETNEGYADQLYQLLLPLFPDLVFIRLGCPGETTVTMLEGGICEYPAGSQLDEGVQQILNNNVLLVTYNIGVNDILGSDCIDQSGPIPTVDIACIEVLFTQIGSNLSLIASTIFSAVETGTPVIGMNYYNTFLALWFAGAPGQELAFLSDQLVQTFNTSVIGDVNALMGFPVADVFNDVFMGADFTTMVPFPAPPPFDVVPVNVALLCQLTFMCPANPEAMPNIHANTEGYALIAQLFFEIFSTLNAQ